MNSNQDDRFNEAVAFVLANEGDYTCNPGDPGGITKFGISEQFVKDNHIATTIKDLTLDEAKKLYKEFFWDKYSFNALNNIKVATKVFDTAVNIGPVPAIKLLQQVVFQTITNPPVDGILGPKTISETNKRYSGYIIGHYKAMLINYYNNLVQKNPKLSIFLKGWHARALR